MSPKAVLSFVGRAVGIAAVLLSPLDAPAAETPDPQKASVETPSSAHGHRHKHDKRDKRDTKARKRGRRHAEGDGKKNGVDAPTGAAPKRESVHDDDAEVTTERTSAKNPPKQSSTPLPTLAAAATRPLAEPIATRSVVAVEPKAHAAEPRRTPIIRASLHTDANADSPRRADAPGRAEKHVKLRGGEADSAPPARKPPCLHAPVNVSRGAEEQTLSLTRCDGSALESAVDQMSILVRPGSAAKPASLVADPHVGDFQGSSAKTKKDPRKDDELAPGIKRIDGRLVERLQLMIDHFAKPTATPKIFVVSGYRPTSQGSFHAMGRAIDFRFEGVENTDLVAFCKTLPDTGCGFYPNSSFIHVDVRDAGTGHVSWIDASGPGEKPAYVAVWPPPPSDDGDAVKLLAKLDELQLLPPPSAPTQEQGTEDAEPSNHAAKSEADSAKRAEPAEQVAIDRSEPASMVRKLEDE